MNLYLILVLIIMLACIVFGYIRGFIRTVYSMCALAIIIILTAVLSPYVKVYIEKNTGIPATIESGLEQKIDLKGKIDEKTDTKYTDYVDKIDLPEQLRDVIKEKGRKAGEEVDSYVDRVSDELVSSVYSNLTEMIVSAIAYLFTMAVISVVVLVIGLLLNIVEKLPVIKQLNKVLGIAAGFVQGYLYISVFYLAALAFGATGIGSSLLEMVNRNAVLSWLYDYNPVVKFVMSLF